MELEEEQLSSIRWHETMLLWQGMQSEVDLQKMEDPLMMVEIVMGRIGIPHEGVKAMDIPIWEEGMNCQETAPLKEGIMGEAHQEVVSLEEISPLMMKMTIFMVMEATGEAPQEHIWEQVGHPTGQLGPEVKAMGVPKPGKYKGQDNLKEFDNWLGQLLKISTEHLTIEEILKEVCHMETAQKAINMHMRLSHISSGGKSFQG
ncbi:hypothetical protein F5J12DRAFT_785807 [Pisolithus orientalis]|uniref:uncharacterized protein n=1 Tax=Pisolithus orientalis TaxID=936130 RepID=UPI0022248863|nr:uncharacterized protein F5J12DRAFT_785807 [Pisolithus orientalis]KAI5994626.1 hypothetical protein F5J12DRAFT_785807 [Pisolithus orientalis]